MTANGCERFDELGLLVAAGAVTPAEQRAFAAHLNGGCVACEAAQGELAEVAARLAASVPPIAPPPGVKARLLSAIERESAVAPGRAAIQASTPTSRPAPRLLWPWATGWGLAAALGIILFTNTSAHRVAVERQMAELETLRFTLEEKEETLRLVEARQTVTAHLAGLAPSPEAFGRVFWNPETNAGLLFAFDLPPPPKAKSTSSGRSKDQRRWTQGSSLPTRAVWARSRSSRCPIRPGASRSSPSRSNPPEALLNPRARCTSRALRLRFENAGARAAPPPQEPGICDA